jgi:quercetin dioxygenase-like cupin family protein
MLTRRGFAACALCAVTGFIASGAEAQNAPAGLKRTILKQMDAPMEGYVMINALVEIEPGATVARHTHPGIESTYVVEGGIELTVEGQEPKKLSPGEAFQVPPNTIHGGKNGDKKTVLSAQYVVEKGKPLATPAP